jgi:hypothetical protein
MMKSEEVWTVLADGTSDTNKCAGYMNLDVELESNEWDSRWYKIRHINEAYAEPYR